MGNILIYSWLELLSFVALHFMVKWQFKFSLLHLLGYFEKPVCGASSASFELHVCMFCPLHELTMVR